MFWAKGTMQHVRSGNCKRVGVGGAKRSRWALQDRSPWAMQAVQILSQDHKRQDTKIDVHFREILQGLQGAQSVEHPTLGFGSGCDLRVMGSSPMSGSPLSRGSA